MIKYSQKIHKNKIIHSMIQRIKKINEDFFAFPMYILLHPIDGFYELKHYHKGLKRVALTYLILASLMGILEFAYTGFIFNTINPSNFDMINSILVSLFPFVIFIIANWSITSLLDGKGNLKEIFLITGYALSVHVWLRIVAILLSNFFTLDEAFFYYGLQTTSYVILFLMMFMGIRSIHEYTILRTVGTVLLTFVSMLIMMFILLLGFSLLQQVVVFIQTIIREMILRL